MNFMVSLSRTLVVDNVSLRWLVFLIKSNYFLSNQLLGIKNIFKMYEMTDSMAYVRILVSFLDFDLI